MKKMRSAMEPLTDKDLARLHVKFVVPLAVSRMLQHLEPMDDVAEYAINEMVGELEPDNALLCIALCAQYVALHTIHLPISKVLKTEANHIVEEYGIAWLARESGRVQADNPVLLDLQNRVPEDLESLGDLLLTVCGELDDETGAVAAILCDILAHQAYTHQDWAEDRLGLLHDETGEEGLSATPGDSGNIILFPRRNS